MWPGVVRRNSTMQPGAVGNKPCGLREREEVVMQEERV